MKLGIMKLGRQATRGPSPVWISVIYAVVGSLWILASDAILILILKDAERVSVLQTYKGLLFIAVTAALLYFVTRAIAAHAKAEATACSGPAETARQPTRVRHGSVITEASPPLIALAVLALAIAATGYFVFQYGKEAIKREKQGDIAAIADLKVNEIARWIAERRADAVAFGRNSFLAAAAEDWLRSGAPSDDTGRRILAIMRNFKETFGYRSVTLMDTQGQVRLNTDGHPPVGHPMRARAIESMHAQTPFLSDLYRAGSGEIAIDLLGPLLLSEGGETRPVGALVFTIDPRQYLFPLIESWPGHMRSGETLLVRREGDEVVFLNELRHRKDTALRLRLPITEPSLPAAMAARGQEGVAEGWDYRGVPVLTALQGPRLPVVHGRQDGHRRGVRLHPHARLDRDLAGRRIPDHHGSGHRALVAATARPLSRLELPPGAGARGAGAALRLPREARQRYHPADRRAGADRRGQRPGGLHLRLYARRVVLQKCWYNKFLQVKSIACYNEATFLEHYRRIVTASVAAALRLPILHPTRYPLLQAFSVYGKSPARGLTPQPPAS